LSGRETSAFDGYGNSGDKEWESSIKRRCRFRASCQSFCGGQAQKAWEVLTCLRWKLVQRNEAKWSYHRGACRAGEVGDVHDFLNVHGSVYLGREDKVAPTRVPTEVSHSNGITSPCAIRAIDELIRSSRPGQQRRWRWGLSCEIWLVKTQKDEEVFLQCWCVLDVCFDFLMVWVTKRSRPPQSNKGFLVESPGSNHVCNWCLKDFRRTSWHQKLLFKGFKRNFFDYSRNWDCTSMDNVWALAFQTFKELQSVLWNLFRDCRLWMLLISSVQGPFMFTLQFWTNFCTWIERYKLFKLNDVPSNRDQSYFLGGIPGF